MATLSSGVGQKGTSGVDGSSQISVEEVEGLLDFLNLAQGHVGRDVIVRIEAHCRY